MANACPRAASARAKERDSEIKESGWEMFGEAKEAAPAGSLEMSVDRKKEAGAPGRAYPPNTGTDPRDHAPFSLHGC